MEGYEFRAGIQRLSLIAQMLEATPVEGILDYIGHAEAVAPLFDPDSFTRGSERLLALRGFISKALEFKRDCHLYRDRLNEAEAAAGRVRRELAERNLTHPDQAIPSAPSSEP